MIFFYDFVSPQNAVSLKDVDYCTKPQINHNATQPQPNITLVGLYTKMTLHTNTSPHHPHKLNVSNISAITDPVVMKLSR